MRSSIWSVAFTLLFVVLTSGVSCHNTFDWIRGLDDCWRECLKDTHDGCDSQKCICEASQSDKYLPPAVACAATSCDSNLVKLKLALILPIQGYCSLAGNAIPDAVLSSAYDAATATATPTPVSGTTRQTERPPKSDTPKTTNKGGDHSTNGDTSSTSSSGEVSSPTSTIDSPASTSSPAQEQPQATTSTTRPQAPERTPNSNGSPFENMQAGANDWRVSWLLVGLGAVVGVFMTL